MFNVSVKFCFGKMLEFSRCHFDEDLFHSSQTLPNNLLTTHPHVLAPLQALLRQRSSASRLDVVTTKNPISLKNSNKNPIYFKNSNADIFLNKFGSENELRSCNYFHSFSDSIVGRLLFESNIRIGRYTLCKG